MSKILCAPVFLSSGHVAWGGTAGANANSMFNSPRDRFPYHHGFLWLCPLSSRPLASPGQGSAPRLTCEGQGTGQVDQGDIIAVFLTVGVSKGEIAPVVDYCLHPQLQAMG